MEKSFRKILDGYHIFREKYASGDKSVMESLSIKGQKPDAMVIACSDSRVDPALILQCDPGELFVVRNVANIVPPFEKDDKHHGTSAALEFGICHLKVKHLILLGHSQCGGVIAVLNDQKSQNDDFISNWVELIKIEGKTDLDPNEYAKLALKKSMANCLTFPWIKERIETGTLKIHLWFFDVKSGVIYTYETESDKFIELKH